MVEDTDGKPVAFSVDLDVPDVYPETEVAEDVDVNATNATSTAAEELSNVGVAPPRRLVEPDILEPIHLEIPDARQHE